MKENSSKSKNVSVIPPKKKSAYKGFKQSKVMKFSSGFEKHCSEGECAGWSTFGKYSTLTNHVGKHHLRILIKLQAPLDLTQDKISTMWAVSSTQDGYSAKSRSEVFGCTSDPKHYLSEWSCLFGYVNLSALSWIVCREAPYYFFLKLLKIN